jgi:hypothetical protein
MHLSENVCRKLPAGFLLGGKGIACILFKLELNQWRIKSVKHRKLDLDVESSLCC